MVSFEKRSQGKYNIDIKDKAETGVAQCSAQEELYLGKLLNLEGSLTEPEVKLVAESDGYPLFITRAARGVAGLCGSLNDAGPGLLTVLSRAAVTVDDGDFSKAANVSLYNLNKKLSVFVNYALTFSESSEKRENGLFFLADLNSKLAAERIQVIISNQPDYPSLNLLLQSISEVNSEVADLFIRELQKTAELPDYITDTIKNIQNRSEENKITDIPADREQLTAFADLLNNFSIEKLNQHFEKLSSDSLVLASLLVCLTNHNKGEIRAHALNSLLRVEPQLGKILKEAMKRDPDLSVKAVLAANFPA